MKFSALILAFVVGCGGESGFSSSGELPPSCPPSGCDNASCVGAKEGAKCLGFTGSEGRGWVGFCVADVDRKSVV